MCRERLFGSSGLLALAAGNPHALPNRFAHRFAKASHDSLERFAIGSPLSSARHRPFCEALSRETV
ncbi:hypothetical protein [Natrinema versiforme]|uniref:Uncharacterized protein n=1 Tax=Natrinema versiforme TaxID=88724 RepID=A0A4P8WN44_9EURY|nr:hypothetical protein [Natrinema versiforme]QCS43783.1 hypothetical protein FEJ81_16015 [Natrinema versiforme]